jgi:hypothetical protein
MWGGHDVEIATRLGQASVQRMRLLGDPVVDRLRTRRSDRRQICGALGLDPDRPIVLAAMERYVNYESADACRSTHNERLARVCEAMTALPQVQLLVRFKAPFVYEEFGDGLQVKQRILERFNRGNIHVDPGGDLYDRLHVADAVVVEYSTVGLEAMLFGKPVLVVADHGVADPIDYVSRGAAVRVVDVHEVVASLTQALTDAAFRDRLTGAQRAFVSWNVVNLDDADPLERFRAFLLGTSRDAESRREAIA